MKLLVLLRGAMGSGKTTFLTNNNLDQYALSADSIRLLLQAPTLELDGKIAISAKQDKAVWAFLMNALESRMERGEFTIIDATHQTTQSINAYRDLCKTHRYRCIVVDFTQVPKDVSLARNAHRPSYKQVPDVAIHRAYERFANQDVPGWVENIQPDDFQDRVQYKPTDFNKYKKVHVIGDLQGCNTVLQEYFDNHAQARPESHPDEMFVFCGDLLDRGIENGLVLEYALKIFNLPNVTIVWGNHEDHLDNWCNDRKVTSREFLEKTLPQIQHLDKKDVRELVRKLAQLCFFTYDNKAILVTHGGLSTLPENLMFIGTKQMVKGIGKYEDDIDGIFTHNTRGLVIGVDGMMAGGTTINDGNVYQVHGHRNLACLPVKASERSYNLEGKVEFSGMLRVVTFEPNDVIVTHEIKNNVFDQGKEEGPKTASGSLLNRLRAAGNKVIQEKKFGDISSFNFTRDVFYDKKWTEDTTAARGIFINTKTEEIVARSYNKFFNVGENDANSLEALQQTLVFPVKVYDKANGYLGITGWDKAADNLIVASKTSLEGPYRDWFSNQLRTHWGANGMRQHQFETLLKDGSLSAIFEVIEPINDPHIVEYPKPCLVLLDLVYRTEEYKKLEYSEMRIWGNRLGFTCKEKVETIDNWTDFLSWYKSVTSNMNICEEGFVIEDSNGFMTKVKLPWYQMWKKMRGVKEKLCLKGKPKINQAMLITPLENQIYGHMKGQDPDVLREKSIIDIRKEMSL